MTPQGQPRVGQKIGDVANEGGSLIAKCGFWLQQTLKLLGRNPTTTVTSLTPSASPFVYENTGEFDVDVLVTGGTVSTVGFSRNGVTFYSMAGASGFVLLNPGDTINVFYTVAPSIVFIPR